MSNFRVNDIKSKNNSDLTTQLLNHLTRSEVGLKNRLETFEKCSISFKIKARDDFNHRNILDISSPARRDERNAEIGQISADFERGRFSKVSFNFSLTKHLFDVKYNITLCGNSSAGRASRCQRDCRGFKSRFPLHKKAA